jgi:hypothetical protein
MADLVAAETTHERAVTGSTHKNRWSWHCFTKNLASINLVHDIFLEPFTGSQQNKIIGAFAMAVRQGQFSNGAHDTLALGTVCCIIMDHISATFKENG